MADKSVCSIPDCGKPSRRRGWCGMHHQRWLRYGDLEFRKGPASGEAIRYYREVVLTYEGDECLIWPFSRSQGYAQMVNDDRHIIVSRRLCEDVNGPPPSANHEAAHSCGRGKAGCVTKGHLSWKTSAENKDDMVSHGTRIRGSGIPWAKLTEVQAQEILRMKGKAKNRDLADRFGVSPAAISQIWSRKSWGWVDP